MEIVKTAEGIFREFEKDLALKRRLNLFEIVRVNNNFYHGKQWEGVNAPDLQKPVFNILKPAVKYYGSMMVSDDIGVALEDPDDAGSSAMDVFGRPVAGLQYPNAGSMGGFDAAGALGGGSMGAGDFANSLGGRVSPMLGGAISSGFGGYLGNSGAAEDGAQAFSSGMTLGGSNGYGSSDSLGLLSASGLDSFGESNVVSSRAIEGILKNELQKVFEKNRFPYLTRSAIKSCAIAGDVCLYTYIEDSKALELEFSDSSSGEKLAQEILGQIKVELVNNTNVHFGNPMEHHVQEQPFVILSFRRLVSDVKAEAKELGIDPSLIESDLESDFLHPDLEGDDYVTVLLKLWRDRSSGKIWAMKTMKGLILRDAWDTGLSRYPLAYMSWEKQWDCYHGTAAITSEINNQIFINQMIAMVMNYIKLYAFPKVVYNRQMFPHGFNNRIGEAVAVNGSPKEAVAAAYPFAPLNAQALELVNITMDKTKEVLGVYDAALGNVKPDNTSAIIAVQRAASQPLELQKMDFYQMVEDIVRSIVEIMASSYGIRPTKMQKDVADSFGNVKSQTVVEMFDFSQVAPFVDRMNVEIGAASYWSELTQIQTLDNLMAMKIIPDALTYLKALPEGAIKNKQMIMDEIERFQQQTQEQMLREQQMAQGAPSEVAAQGLAM